MGIQSARGLVLAAATIGIVISLFAVIRLGAVVSATPTSAWFVEYPPLVDLTAVPDRQLAEKAAFIFGAFRDPALVSAQIPVCLEEPDHTGASCRKLVNEALLGAPASGELWLAKVWALALGGDIGPEAFDALRNSFAFARREGWIAADRVLIGLQLYRLLPADLQKDVQGDLGLVLGNDDFSLGLVDAYAADATLRTAANEAVSTLPADKIEWFVSRVRRSVRDQ